MRRPEAIKKIKEVLQKVAPNADVFLFGSEARGESRIDSDFDILVLEDADFITVAREKEITTPLFMLGYSDGIEVQPIVTTKSEWENRPFVTPFYQNVMNDRVKL